MKKNTKKQSFDEITSLYCKVVNALNDEYSGFNLDDVKKSLETIILNF